MEAEQIVSLLPRRFPLQLAPVSRHLPTELPQLSLHLQRLDRVFELTDGTILDLEFENDLRVADLRRFFGYGLGLLDSYPGQPVHTVALCGPRTRRVPAPFDLAPIPYRLTCVLIGDQDGQATLTRLRALAASGRRWSDEDRLDLILLPLMRHRQSTERVVRTGLRLARALPEAEQPRAMGALLALGYHYAGEALLNRLLEDLMHTTLLDQIVDERVERAVAERVERAVAERVERAVAERVERAVVESREEGRTEGRMEGERLLLRRLLTERFGAIPQALEAGIASAETATLTALFDRALRAASIDELM